jgi:glycosyltransferase involved in cell wall biosynthesis
MVKTRASSAVIGIDASRAVSSAPTGTEAYSYHLIRALAPRLRETDRLRLYYRAPPPDGTDPLKGAADGEARVIPFPRLWTHTRLSWEMLRSPPDLLFVPAHVLPLVRPARTLVTVHDLGYRAFPDAHPPGQRRYLELSTRWNVRVASHVLADSGATREAIVEAYSIPQDKISIVYPGYAPDLEPVRDPDRIGSARRRYGIPGDYLLFIGRIQPRKNLSRLIAAFAQIASRYPDLTLVLAGPSGWLTGGILEQVQNSRVSSRVQFPGYIAAEDKAAIISGARAFAYPSLYEGFGFPVLEAQACGTPVLSSSTSSLPEVAGKGALLVDPEDTGAIAAGLSRLLDEPHLRQSLITHGFENLSRFSWDLAAAQVEATMAMVLAS